MGKPRPIPFSCYTDDVFALFIHSHWIIRFPENMRTPLNLTHMMKNHTSIDHQYL
jgi:hypothetical protein